MKAGPLNPPAHRRPLLATEPLTLQVVAGTTYVLAVRGDLTGSVIAAVSYLGTRADIEVADEDVGGVTIENFPTTQEGTLCTSGNLVVVTRVFTPVGSEPPPDLVVSMAEVKLSGRQ